MDNATVYILLFTDLSLRYALLTIATFFALLAASCAAAALTGGHKKLAALVPAAGHWFIPIVFILIGGWIAAASVGAV